MKPTSAEVCAHNHPMPSQPRRTGSASRSLLNTAANLSPHAPRPAMEAHSRQVYRERCTQAQRSQGR
eukprot:1174627-Lingulodinium_polyedra.AAC.1